MSSAKSCVSLASFDDGISELSFAFRGFQPDVDAKDDDGRPPLSWVARQGHEAVVRLLLATGAVDVDAKYDYCRTPLSWAP